MPAICFGPRPRARRTRRWRLSRNRLMLCLDGIVHCDWLHGTARCFGDEFGASWPVTGGPCTTSFACCSLLSLSIFGQCHGILSGCSFHRRTPEHETKTFRARSAVENLSRELHQHAPDDISFDISTYIACWGRASRDHPPGVKADQLIAACQPALFAAKSLICSFFIRQSLGSTRFVLQRSTAFEAPGNIARRCFHVYDDPKDHDVVKRDLPDNLS
jgi:hypothetical protein